MTDLGLPDGSGLELGRRFGESLPVIAVSGYGQREDVQATRSANFKAHLIKPVDPNLLHRMVTRLVVQQRSA